MTRTRVRAKYNQRSAPAQCDLPGAWPALLRRADSAGSYPVSRGFVDAYQAALRSTPRRPKKGRAEVPWALTSTQYLVALEMSEFCDWGTGENCRPGVDKLAALTKLDRTTVMRARDDLEAAGWLELVGERGSTLGSKRTNCYTLTLPTGCAVPLVDPRTGRTLRPVTGSAVLPVQNPTGRTLHTTGRTVHLTGGAVRPDLFNPFETKTAGESICVWCEGSLSAPGWLINDDGEAVACHHEGVA
jgi:hypothetical protein